MWVRGGLLAEGKYLGSGISHFFEHIFFKGTKNRGPGEIAREIHSLGGELNAATSIDFTYYKIVLPREHLDKGLEILSDAFINSSFPEKEFAREKQVILKEINMGEDTPSKKLWKVFFREAFVSHPYREPVIGRKVFFKSLTREDLLAFYKSCYMPQHMVLAVAGGVEAEVVKEKAEYYFKDWRISSNFSLPSFKEPPQISYRRRVEYFPGEKAYLMMGFHIPGIESEDLYSLDLLACILGKGRGARLYGEIKERKGLADSISAFSYTPSGEGILGIEAVTEPKNIDNLERGILREIEEIKENGILEKELSRAKNIIRSQHNLSQEDVESVASDIGYNKLILGDADFSQYYLERIKEVTRDEIRDTAVKFLKKENLTTCILTPERELVKREEKKAEERNIYAYKFPGLVLLVSQSRISSMVNLQLLFRGGVIYEKKEKNGIFSLLSKCLIRSTKEKEYLNLHSEIEARGASLSSYSGYNSFGLSLTLIKEDIGWGIETLASLLKSPLFKEEDIKKAKEELESELKIEDDDVLTRAFYLFREAIFGRHPYSWRDKGTPEAIKKITRRDLIYIYQKFCLGQVPVLAVFGNIDRDEVARLVEKNFGFLNRNKGKFKQIPLPAYATSHREVTLPRKQSIVVLGFPGVSVKDKDRFSIDVITTALSGQSGRLFNAIREQKGYAYYVGAFQILGLVPGAIVFYAGTVPENVREVKRIMEEEIYRLKEGFLSDEEIEKAKENLIGKKRISLQTNRGFAFESALNELYGLGYDFYLRYEQNIRKIDKARIREIASKYFKPEKISYIIINPEKK